MSADQRRSGVVPDVGDIDKAVLGELVMAISFQAFLKRRQRAQMAAFKFVDPSFGNPIDRHGIGEMHLVAAVALPRKQVRFPEDRQMIRDGQEVLRVLDLIESLRKSV